MSWGVSTNFVPNPSGEQHSVRFLAFVPLSCRSQRHSCARNRTNTKNGTKAISCDHSNLEFYTAPSIGGIVSVISFSSRKLKKHELASTGKDPRP